MNPYIGVTGFTKPEEVRAVLDKFPNNAKHKLMVGVLATWKSLRDIEIKPKWAKQTPVKDLISTLFFEDKRVLNLVHYSTESGHESTILEDLLVVHDLAGSNFEGFQLNITWPEVSMLEEYRAVVGWEHRLVLQIGSKAVEFAGSTPEGVVDRLSDYQGIVDDILLDPSGGLGIPFDSKKAIEYLQAVSEKDFGFGLGVAGGLGPSTMKLIVPVAERFPDISIDAQGRLRDTDNNLDLEVANDYIKMALKIFG